MHGRWQHGTRARDHGIVGNCSKCTGRGYWTNDWRWDYGGWSRRDRPKLSALSSCTATRRSFFSTHWRHPNGTRADLLEYEKYRSSILCHKCMSHRKRLPTCRCLLCLWTYLTHSCIVAVTTAVLSAIDLLHCPTVDVISPKPRIRQLRTKDPAMTPVEAYILPELQLRLTFSVRSDWWFI